MEQKLPGSLLSHNTKRGFVTLPRLCWIEKGRSVAISGRRVVLGAGLWAEPGAAEQGGCSHSKSQAGNSRRQNFSVFQFSKIERIKQIRADVPTCNYQLISSDFFFKKKGEISK